MEFEQAAIIGKRRRADAAIALSGYTREKVKACTQRTYPLPLALQMAQSIPLPTYAGPGAALWKLLQADAMRKAQRIVQTPEV